MRGQEARLEELGRERDAQQEALNAARERLGAQIRAAYRAGRNDFVKLLLNQEDPALIGRVLVYHDYFSRARAHRIAAVSAAMGRLDALEMEIRAETLALGRLQTQQAAKLEELTAHRDSRSAVIARLDRHIRERGEELRHLQTNERELAALIERLKQQESAVGAFEELPPFETLKGRLSWPVDGRQAVSFGSPRKGGRLRAEGVTIEADAGTEVRAVAGGTVVFADWFRNMGLLIIIDHGGGYMSLYAHNEALAKKPGDFVRAGDVIGRVGDTGGQERAALYFEIRAEGAPVDPALWCRRG
jgi:septal ring factor EnvC (AmiA/AmiB activator)